MRVWINRWKVQLMVISLGFLFLLFYEAAQQDYFITTFDLANGRPVLFQEVLIGQFKKWLVWILLSIPFILYIRNYPLSDNRLTFSHCGRYFLVIIIMLLVNIVLISGLHIYSNNLNFNTATMTELMTFYSFQKGPIYILAYIGLIIMVHLFLNQSELKITIEQLSGLKETNLKLYEELRLKTMSDASFTINVKVGNKWKPILLEEIYWIEADDYCVKLHLKETTYTQRSSMKSLEKQLPDTQFLRVHRKSIVNIGSIEEFQLAGSPHVRLKNGEVINISQSRLKTVRKALASQTPLAFDGA